MWISRIRKSSCSFVSVIGRSSVLVGVQQLKQQQPNPPPQESDLLPADLMRPLGSTFRRLAYARSRLQHRPRSFSCFEEETQITFRNLQVSDQEFVWKMLRYAANEESPAAVRAQISIHKYAASWGKIKGDFGIAAMEKGNPVGAAYGRLWHQEKGYGFVDEETPELVLAVLPSYQSKGIGTKLLTKVISSARDHGYSKLSLSVRSELPAYHLYKRFGFATVSAYENRTGGTSIIMLKHL